MLRISYGNNLEYCFPRYYSDDAGWYLGSESNTKSYFSKIIKPNFKIIDAGAQIGMYTVLFSKLASGGSVYAFEPTDTVNLLKENLEFNDCKNVQVHNLALSNRDGKFKDTIFKIWSQGVVENRDFEFMTIDTFVRNNSIEPDLIKIDVDSYDFEVLQGCKETLIKQSPIVVVELNYALEKRGFKPSDAIEFMTSVGYRVNQILDSENFLFMKE